MLDKKFQIDSNFNVNTDSPAAIGANSQRMHLQADYSNQDDLSVTEIASDKIDDRACVAFQIDAVRLWAEKQSNNDITAYMYKRDLNISPVGYWYAKNHVISDYSGNNNPGFFFNDVPEILISQHHSTPEDTILSIDFTVDQINGDSKAITTRSMIENETLVSAMTISGDLNHRSINIFPAKHQHGHTMGRLIADNGIIKKYALFTLKIESINPLFPNVCNYEKI